MARYALVLGGGDLHAPDDAKALLTDIDLVVAADGGARHCAALGIQPDALVGDFDSIDADLVARYATEGVVIDRHPVKKDETDLELALLYAQNAGATRVLVLGGTGSRWDQTLASVLLTVHEALRAVEITFWDGGQRLFAIRGEATIQAEGGELVSLIPVGGDAVGVRTAGLAYPLRDETLPLGTTRGVSNVMEGERATVWVADGLLLCVVGAQEMDG